MSSLFLICRFKIIIIGIPCMRTYSVYYELVILTTRSYRQTRNSLTEQLYQYIQVVVNYDRPL